MPQLDPHYLKQQRQPTFPLYHLVVALPATSQFGGGKKRQGNTSIILLITVVTHIYAHVPIPGHKRTLTSKSMGLYYYYYTHSRVEV